MPAIADYITALKTAAGLYRHEGLVLKASTCDDIARKLERFGAFASLRQQTYAEALIREAPGLGAQGQLGRVEGVRFIEPTTLPADPADPANAHLAQTTAVIGDEATPRLGGNVWVGPAEVRPPVEAPTPVDPAALRRINELFATARANGLIRPRIRITIDGMRLQLSPGVRNPAATNVRANGSYAGWISAEGAWVTRPQYNAPAGIPERLSAFGLNPEELARVYGHATHHCCFCTRPLTDERSTRVGYGPICAENYGLAWGERTAADQRSRINTIRRHGLSRYAAPTLATASASVISHNADSITIEGILHGHGFRVTHAAPRGLTETHLRTVLTDVVATAARGHRLDVGHEALVVNAMVHRYDQFQLNPDTTAVAAAYEQRAHPSTFAEARPREPLPAGMDEEDLIFMRRDPR